MLRERDKLQTRGNLSSRKMPLEGLSSLSGTETPIRVTVRIRPLNEQEMCHHLGGEYVLKAVNDHVVAFDPPPENTTHVSGQKVSVKSSQRRYKDLRYAFDIVLDETSSQQEAYEASTRGLVDSVLNGFNATVFAYGATGAGKTYTMLGVEEDPGIMIRTMDELFRKVEDYRDHKIIDVTISYLEVYNETIRDLLMDSSTVLELREDPERGMIVAGLSEHQPRDTTQVLELLARGNTHRSQSPTDANEQSSRSHAVLQIKVEQRDRTANISTDVRFAKLSLIDLAGSERASVTKNRGERLIEGANINRSLLALGNCINALGGKSKRHIPYRDSKLTRLLKDSLGGNCLTVMIANISPSRLHYEDTHNTLKYANRAKEIRVKVEQNIMSVQYHMSQYTDIIAQLRDEVQELKQKLVKYETGDASLAERQFPVSSNPVKLPSGPVNDSDLGMFHQQLIDIFKERRSLHVNYLDLCKTLHQTKLRKAYLESLEKTFQNLSHFKRIGSMTELTSLTSAIDLTNRAHQTIRVHLANVESNLDHNQVQLQTVKSTLNETFKNSLIYDRLISDIETALSDTGTWISADMNDLISESVTLQSSHVNNLLKSYSALWSLLPESIHGVTDSFSTVEFKNVFSCLLKALESNQLRQLSDSMSELTSLSKLSTDKDKRRHSLTTTLQDDIDPELPSDVTSSTEIHLADYQTRTLSSPQRQPLPRSKRKVSHFFPSASSIV